MFLKIILFGYFIYILMEWIKILLKNTLLYNILVYALLIVKRLEMLWIYINIYL